MRFPLKNPSPDFETFTKVLRGKRKPDKVHFVELGIDEEVMKYITENIFGEKWIPNTEETTEAYLKQMVNFYYRMGYDYVPGWISFRNMPGFKERKTSDTAKLSKGQRSWVEEGGGIIKNWDDFEKISWNSIEPDLRPLEFIEKNLKDGMKITVGTTVFEMILERFLGYQDLFILSVDNPQLVEEIFNQWGGKVYAAYKESIQHPKVGAIFHADDLGFKTATMVSPEFLRKNVFPWFKKYASLAHNEGKMYWYHCCGNVLSVMEDLIENVKIDAFHSFQDVIIPVGNFLKIYGNRIAALGGIDMDRLSRLKGKELKKYIKDTLDKCMPGRYALGSGNTIANYIPPENYLIMLDEGLNWKG